MSPRSLSVFTFMARHHDRLMSIEKIPANQNGEVTDREIEAFQCFEPKGIYYFGKALASRTNITHLAFKDTKISDTLAIFLAHGLINGNSKLTSISFTFSRSTSCSLGNNGAKALASVPSIRTLTFNNTHVTGATQVQINQQMESRLNEDKKLKESKDIALKP